jgi:hypothetical protein
MKNCVLSDTKYRFWFALLVIALALGATVQAGLQIPYTPDTFTLHLWHLDDPNGATTPDAVATGGITLTNIGLPAPGTGPYTNTSLGNASFPGLGNCMSGNHRSHLLYGGPFTDVSQFCHPDTGAFTFEAVVKFDIDPLGAMDAEILAGDNAGGLTTRGWQWRIFNGVMEWDLLAGSLDNDFKAVLPAVGPNAAVAGTWYHAAVTYSGDAPANGDTPNLITLYWTLLDANRTSADKLAQFTATRPLNGSPQGNSQPSLGIGGSARAIAGANPGNSEGIIGSIDEVRISNIARGSNQMAFVAAGAANPPTFTKQPPPGTLVGYGQVLTVPALVSGTLPLRYQWQQNGTNVTGQTDTTMVVPYSTFAQAGNYQLVVTNAYGSKTSSVAQVTVGAVPTGLFNTGLDTNGILSTGNIADPHWTLFRSADPAYLGPDTFIFEYSNPIQFASANGNFSPTNGVSMWMGAGGNSGGSPVTSPAGQYVYRARFLLDSADPTTVTMSGNLWVNGSISNILVNGKSTGITLAPGGTLYVATFSITNGFVQGWNTVDFVENLPNGGISALRVEVRSAGLALPPGLPVILEQPLNQTVRDGSVAPGNSKASFSTAALGRPPLSYQWLADGAPVNGATNRTLTLLNPAGRSLGTNFTVVVRNDSGSITSQVAVLKLVSTNQPPVVANFNLSTLPDQPVSLPLSQVLQSAIDPDGDALALTAYDATSTNGLGSVDGSGAAFVYTPPTGYLGTDSFRYTLSDGQASAVGTVKITIGQPAPPLLTISRISASQLRIAWPSAADGFVLQSSRLLPGNFADAGLTVTTEANESVVRVTPDGAPRFFRLFKP